MTSSATLLPPAANVPDVAVALSSALTVADIDVQTVAVGQWRLRDRRLRDDDSSGLLGFVEKTRRISNSDAVFELMTLTGGFDFFSFASLEEAITHVALHAHEGGGNRKRDGFSWISVSK